MTTVELALKLRSSRLSPYCTINSSGNSGMKVPITVHWISTLEVVMELLINNTGRLGARPSVERRFIDREEPRGECMQTSRSELD